MKKLEEKFQQQLKEVKGDMERETKLREAQEREMEEKIKELRGLQEFQARQKAEKKNSIIHMIIQMIKAGSSILWQITHLIN